MQAMLPLEYLENLGAREEKGAMRQQVFTH